MTGLLGGGHAIYWDAATGDGAEPRLLLRRADPGIGRRARRARGAVRRGARPLRGRAGRCAVPGVPAGLDALWSAHGRLPWPRLVEPALRLARDGVRDAARARVLPRDARAGDDDARGRAHLRAGRPAARDGRPPRAAGPRRSARVARRRGRRRRVHRDDRRSLLALSDERGGLVTARRPRGVRGRAGREPVEAAWLGRRFLTRGGLSGVPETLARAAAAARTRAGRARRSRCSRRSTAARAGDAHDEPRRRRRATGNACVLTTSLGLGSGDFLPGLDLHLNSMLGETDLRRRPARAGRADAEHDGAERSRSTATASCSRSAPPAARGSARALVGVAAGILDEGLEPQEAVDRPRVHLAGGVVNAEPGVDEDALAQLEARAAPSGAGPRCTTTSAASAPSRGEAPRRPAPERRRRAGSGRA